MLCATIRILRPGLANHLERGVPARGASAWTSLRKLSGTDGGDPARQEPQNHQPQNRQQLQHPGATERTSRPQQQRLINASQNRGDRKTGGPSSPLAEKIKASSRQRRFGYAMQTLKNAEKPTASQARSVLKSMAFDGQFRPTTLALERLRSLGVGCARDYELAIMAHVKHSAPRTLELLDSMERDGLPWTEIACGSALRACGIAGELGDAVDLIHRMKEYDISPNGVHYIELIRQCVRGREARAAGDRGGSRRAVELLRLMDDTGPAPDTWHYTAALTVCATLGDAATASAIFQEMRDKGIEPTAHSWTALMRAGPVDRMLSTYGEMCASGLRPDIVTMNAMLSRAATEGRCDVAEAIWKELHGAQAKPNAASYGALMNCYATARDPAKAEEVLAAMSKSDALTPNDMTYGSLMKAYIKAGQLDDAVLVIARMRAAHVEPLKPNWTHIIGAADAVGDHRMADELYTDALSSKALKVYQRWRSHDDLEVAPGRILTRGAKMSLLGLDRGTAKVAVRHELQHRQERTNRSQLPLCIVTGAAGSVLTEAVIEVLTSSCTRHLAHSSHRGSIMVLPAQEPTVQ